MADVHSGRTVDGEPVASGGGAASKGAARKPEPSSARRTPTTPARLARQSASHVFPTARSAVRERARAGSRTEESRTVTGRSSGPFGGLSPQEAGQLSAKSRREKRRQQDLTSDQKVEAALRKKAEAGDVSAARELREWIRASVGGASINEDILRALTREGRQVLRRMLCNPALQAFLAAQLSASHPAGH
jgi:hypothetical protein